MSGLRCTKDKFTLFVLPYESGGSLKMDSTPVATMPIAACPSLEQPIREPSIPIGNIFLRQGERTMKMNEADPKILEQLNAKYRKYDEAFNRNDAAAVAAFFTE